VGASRLDIALAWLGFIVLMVLHIDFWRTASDTLYFGWMPETMAYRVAWIIGSWVYLMFFCARIWRREP